MSLEGNAKATYELRGKLGGVLSNVIDNTLSIEGAAADAKATGDAIKGLTASDVGARPNNWTPTASEVGATPASHATDKNNPHGVTAAQVGARPNTWMPTASEVGAIPGMTATWLPYHGMTLEELPDGLFAYSVNPGNMVSVGAPTNFSEYGTIFGIKSTEYDVYQYLDVFGNFAVRDKMSGKWIAPFSENNKPTPDDIGLPYFKTYYFESDSMLNALKNNYNSISNGACIIYAKTGYSYVTVVGYKVDNHAAFLELWYADGSLYKYWNVNGTWSQCYYSHGG